MAERVILRLGTGTTPPLAMLPGELACTPDDGMLWLGEFGDGAPVRAAGLTIDEVSAVIAANAPGFQNASQVSAAIAANAPGFQNASQVSAAIAAALAGITLDGGTF